MLAAQSSDAVFSLSAFGSLTAVNEASQALTGYSSAALLRMEWTDLVVPEEEAHAGSYLAAALEGEPATFTTALLTKARARRVVQVTVVPMVADGAVVGLYGVARDVTEQQRTEQALRASERYYRQILEEIAEGYFEVDLSGRVQRVNDSLCRQLGAPPEEVIGHLCFDLLDEDNTALVKARLGAVLATGEAEPGFVVWFRRPDGQLQAGSVSATLVTDAAGTPVGFRGVMRERTEQQRFEEALQRSEERYRLISRATQEILWDADLREGTTTWTGAIREVTGIDSDSIEFSEAWWRRRVHPDDWDAVFATTQAVIESDQGLYQHEFRVLREDGSYATILSRGYVVRDEHGTAARLVGSMMDITVRTRREAELLEARREADEASRAKSQFLANMSHEIRTPMNGVIGMVDLLQGTALTTEQTRYVDAVRRSGERLLVIINDILDLSKVEAGKLRLAERPFDVRAMVAGTLGPLEAEAEAKGLRLEVGIAPKVPVAVHGDPERVAQVLTNLVGNAVKFTDRGRVAVEVRVVEDGALRLVVEDTGIGMTRTQVAELFQPFVQADVSTTKRYGGTGLGLAISRQLVELMGGRIEARSVFGVGTAFVVDLPLLPARGGAALPVLPEPPEPSLPPAGPHAPGGAAVLVVEDNDVNQEVARLMLMRLGHRVHVVPGGVQALEVLRTRTFDVVLMDIQMPVMDGVETTRRLREAEAGSGRRTPVVAMTANALPDDRRRALAADMDDYLAKPVHLEELDAAVARWAAAGRVREAPVTASEVGPAPEPEVGPEVAVLEPAVTATLRSVARSMPATFLAELVDTFVHETELRLVELVAAVDHEDVETVVRLSHAAKGGCASMGTTQLGALLDRIERQALAGECDAVRTLAGALLPELARATTALEHALARQPA